MALSVSATARRYDADARREAGSYRPRDPSRPLDPARAAGAESDPSRPKGAAGKPLSEDDRRTVDELKKRDRAVRAHEQAHMASGGALVHGGATYSFQVGPDGLRYAVGGEVSIDTSTGKSPQETVARAQTIQAAALAPADPSGQDRAVAAKAAKMATEARKALSARASDPTPTGATDPRVATGIAAYRAASERPHASPTGLELLA